MKSHFGNIFVSLTESGIKLLLLLLLELQLSTPFRSRYVCLVEKNGRLCFAVTENEDYFANFSFTFVYVTHAVNIIAKYDNKCNKSLTFC